MANLQGANPQTTNLDGDKVVDQFLTPEAMLTPGFAGALVMMISNSLANNFNLSPAYTGLILSFICGLLVIVVARRWWMRITYYVLNSLIIFCVAFGANGLGQHAAGTTALAFQPIGAASAQPTGNSARNAGSPNTRGNPSAPASSPSQTQLEQTIQEQRATIDRLKSDVEKLQKRNSSAVQQKGFFQPWTFK